MTTQQCNTQLFCFPHSDRKPRAPEKSQGPGSPGSGMLTLVPGPDNITPNSSCGHVSVMLQEYFLPAR